MLNNSKKKIRLVTVLTLILALSCSRAFSQDNGEIYLKDWKLKSSLQAKEDGRVISAEAYKESGWYAVQVPTTVLRALVKNGVYPEPREDLNNYKIPDASDEFNAKHDLAKYSYLPNKENPWKDPYWFRTEFTLPAKEKERQVWLNFNGINYRADVWVNGKLAADSTEMKGMFQRFKFNITKYVNAAGKNYIAVKIYQVDHPGTPTPGVQKEVFGDTRRFTEGLFKDVTLKISGGWDCAPVVRDRNMGIYQDVYLSFTNDVDIRNPFIVTDLPLPDTTSADLKITAELVNVSPKAVKGILRGKIDLLNEIDFVDYTKKYSGVMKSVIIEKEVVVPPNSTILVTLDKSEFPQLTVKNPHLWYPNGYGEQYLHKLNLSFEAGGKESAKKSVTFGIREVTNILKELNGEYGRVFYINGNRVFCRGGWLQPDILLDMNKQRLYKEARLLAKANMNMIANEDMPSPTEDFMESCDKYGLMLWGIFYQCFTMVPGTPTAENPLDHDLATKCSIDILKRYRNNPSLVLYCASVEVVPGKDLYNKLKTAIHENDTTRPFIPASSIWWNWEELTPYIKDELPLGVTDHEDPDYTWYPLPYYFNKVLEVRLQMFRNELGVPSVPNLNSLKRFIFNLGTDKTNPLFPLDSVWAEHGAWDYNGYAFKAYHEAIKNVYGFNTTDIADYVRTSQIVNADSYRAMYEAANHRMWDITSGVMTWKLNDCYPSVLWQIYDWYLNPNAAYYFTKKACEPIHIQMNAHDYKVSVINTYHRGFQELTANVKVYDYNLNLKWQKEEKFSMEEDRYQELFNVPKMDSSMPVYFVKLELKDNTGKVLSSNLYWESFKAPADLSALRQLERVKPEIKYDLKEEGLEYVIHVTLKNATNKLSFFNRLALMKKEKNEEALPAYWEDNYITLFPGEEREIEVRVAKTDMDECTAQVVVDDNI